MLTLAITKAKESTANWDAVKRPSGVWVTVPHVPPSLNVWSRKHWRVRHKQVEEMTEVMRLLKAARKIPRYERVEVQLVYYFRDGRKRDPDNYAGKFILDGLKKSGIIADDNSKVLRLPQPEFRVDKLMPRTEVFISEWHREED